MGDFVSFGEWVRQRRKVLGITQAALARQVGCAAVTIKKIEQDERRPSAQVAQLLADTLVISPSLRNDFVQMARGQYVPSIHSPEKVLQPPAFLKHPPVAGRQEPAPFVARQRELAQLDAHLATALTGQGQVVFIVGEAGRGKTRLMTEFAERAQKIYSDLIVATGHCDAPAGSGNPYLPFRDVLNMLTGDLESRWIAGNISQEQVLRLWALLPYTIQAICERGRVLIDTLISGIPLTRRIIPHISSPAKWLEEFETLVEQQKSPTSNIEQSQLLEQVTQVLQALASRQPLLLILDDLQWIDDASRNLLFHLGRRLAGSRILILGAYRPSEIGLGRPTGRSEESEQHPLEPVINEFKRYFGDIQIDLGRYDPTEGRAFIDAYIDNEPNHLGESFRQRLFQHTKGHPLFTVEILRDMQENGSLIRDESRVWIEKNSSSTEQLPARVEAVIEQRVNRLDTTLQNILTIASVEGEEFIAQVVARVANIDERLLLHRLAHDLRQRYRLVQEQREEKIDQQRLTLYQFDHVLFTEYLYHRLSPTERRSYHLEIAEALEAIFEWPTREIIHPLLHEGASIDDVLDRPFPDWLVRFSPVLAHHFWQGQEWSKAAGYALCAGVMAVKAYALREAITYFERALEALDHAPQAPMELVYEAIMRWVGAAFTFKPYPEQLRRLSQAEAIARDLNDKPRLIRALHWTARVHLAKGLWTRAGTALAECLTLAEELGDERLTVRPMYFKALMTTFANPRDALVVLSRALNLARKYEDRHIEAITLATAAQTYAQLGEFGQAREVIQQASEVIRVTDSPLTQSDVDLLSAWAYLAMGDVQHGLEYGQRSIDRAIATDNMDCICYGYDCVGYSYLELKRIAEATLAFSEAIERSKATGATIPGLLGQAGLAMSKFCSGHVDAIDEMETAIEQLQNYDNPVGAANTARMLGTCLIQLGDFDNAERYLRMACDFYRRMGMYPYLVNTLPSLAQLLEKQKRSGEAQDIQAEAQSLLLKLNP